MKNEEREAVKEKYGEKVEVREVLITLVRDKKTSMEGLLIECIGVPPLELIGVLTLALQQAKDNMIAGRSKSLTDELMAKMHKQIKERGIPRPDNGEAKLSYIG